VEVGPVTVRKKLDRRDRAEVSVVSGLDLLEDRLPEFVTALPGVLVEKLASHRRPERFHAAVVDARRDPAHGSEQPCQAQPMTEHPGSVLGSPIRMNDGSWFGLASPPRHIERVNNELCADVVGDRPSDHAAGEHVHDGRAIDLPGPPRMSRDVSDPELVRAVRDERAVLPGKETGPRDSHYPTGKGPVDPSGDEAVDHRKDPYGPTTSRTKYDDACRRISISAA